MEGRGEGIADAGKAEEEGEQEGDEGGRTHGVFVSVCL